MDYYITPLGIEVPDKQSIKLRKAELVTWLALGWGVLLSQFVYLIDLNYSELLM